LESGELQDVRPGPSCYDGNILGCVRSQSWNDAISTYDNMKLSQVVPSPAACHGILLAHARRGGRVDVQTCLEDFISLGAQLRIDGLLFALSMLVPEMELKERVDMESVRHYLRSICEKDMTLKRNGLNLMRSLRIAELEEQRTETPGLSESAIATRRKEALDVVLRDVVAFANTATIDRVD
jgi:hypothetical protein